MPSARELFTTIDDALNQGRLDDARAWRDALRADAKDPIALTLLGRIAAAEGDVISGVTHIGEAIRLEPYYEPAYRYRSELFFRAGMPDRAIQDIESLMMYYPSQVDLITNYAETSMRLGRTEHASQYLERVVRRNPSNAFFANLSGLIRQAAKEYEEACSYYRRAISLEPNNPHYLNNLGTALHNLDKVHEAQVMLEKALSVDANFEMAWYNLGNVFKDTRRFEQAERCYRRAIELRPDYPDARLNLGCVLIQQNRWEEGWKQYEWRWRVPNLLAQPDLPMPRWTGEPLAGKSLLIFAEQGIGDTLQFARYLHEVVARGAKVTFICPPEVASLMSRVNLDITVSSSSELPQVGGFWAPLMSLPPLLQMQPDAIPAAPYLEVEEDRVAYYRTKLGRRRGKLRIGIVWGGNPQQQDDRHRSMPLDALQALFDIKNVRWVGLQKGPHLDELKAGQYPIEDWSDELDTFDETGALMKALDGVVTVCSSPLHLAGALGVRTIGMLNWAADWRWGLEGDSTAWYSSVKLLRQPVLNDWATVARAAATEIAKWKAATSAKVESTQALRKPAPTIRRKTNYGVMDLLMHDTYITKSLATMGEYCQDEINLLARYVKSGAVIVEAGANIGAHTLPLSGLVGKDGLVIAIEPQAEAFRLLERNVAQNDLHNVQPRRAALGDAERTMHMPEINYRLPNNFGGLSFDIERTEGEEIPCITIDSLKLDRCDVIKLDLEGAETAAIRGALATIARHKPLLYIEEAFDQNSETYRAELEKLGYKTYRHRALLNSDTTNRARADSRPFFEWSCSCFAVPADGPQPTDLAPYAD